MATDARELGAQIADMAVDGAVGDGESRPMQLVDDGVAGEYPGWRRGQGLEDAELGDGEGNFGLVPSGAPGVDIEGEPAAVEAGASRSRSRRGHGGRAAQD